MHAAGIELHDAVGVRNAAVADAILQRIELDDVDAGDQRVENILAFGHETKSSLDTRLRSTVLVLVAVAGGNHDRLDATAGHGRGLRRRPGLRRGRNARGGAREHELSAVHPFGRVGIMNHERPQV